VQLRADEVELGDSIAWEGVTYKVDGWFIDGNGRLVIEFNNQNHVFHRGDRLQVQRKNTDATVKRRKEEDG
jgi:hypothetical protein